MKNDFIPYMAFVETAPHNKGKDKEYDHVAGCLIAYVFKLCLALGEGDYKGQLFFDVLEETEQDEQRLIKLYREKYGAIHLGGTTFVIIDDHGDKLVDKYLPDK